jgi:hypothetical protein
MKKPSKSNQGTFLPQGLAAPFLEATKIRKSLWISGISEIMLEGMRKLSKRNGASADNARPRPGAGQSQHHGQEDGGFDRCQSPSSWQHVDNSKPAPQIQRIPRGLQ